MPPVPKAWRISKRPALRSTEDASLLPPEPSSASTKVERACGASAGVCCGVGGVSRIRSALYHSAPHDGTNMLKMKILPSSSFAIEARMILITVKLLLLPRTVALRTVAGCALSSLLLSCVGTEPGEMKRARDPPGTPQVAEKWLRRPPPLHHPSAHHTACATIKKVAF